MLKLARPLFMRLGALVFGSLVAFGVLELTLRIYNPFYASVRGDRIVLQANRTFTYNGQAEHGTDASVTYRTNSLGFRGPDLPQDGLKDRLSVFTVGGSTTNSLTLNEPYTWSGQLWAKLRQVDETAWLNNAGLPGHSTFAHLQLLQDHVLPRRPRYVLFLIGINDVGHSGPTDYDWSNLKRGLSFTSHKTLIKSLGNYSESVSLALNLFRWKRAADRGLPYRGMRPHEFLTAPVEPASEVQQIVDRHATQFIPGYRDRVRQLVTMCHDAGTTPVLITQPTLYGDVTDDVTNVDLATIQVPELTDQLDARVSGSTHWRVVQKYNDVLRQIGRDNGVVVIDLAEEMPKSSAFYYDWIHFTNHGAQEVAEIIWDRLEESLLQAESLARESDVGPRQASG